MLIDWFTVGAQALNFVILVWLMKRFLYQPILDAIDAREQRVAAELADADAKKAEAEKERDVLRSKNEALDRERAGLLSQAAEEAGAERRRLLEGARQAAKALRAEHDKTLRRDAHDLRQALARRTGQEVFAISRKVLGDLASASLEERIGDVFIGRLREIDGEAKERLGKALAAATDPALLRSAFDLPAEQREAIQRVLNEIFSAEVPVRFETAPSLISGIELTTEGQKVSWSIADYLTSLEKSVGELLAEPAEAEPVEAEPVEAEPVEAES